MPAPRVRVKVVDQIAAANNQDAFIPQGRKFPTDVEMKRRRLGLVNAELNHWNIGCGIAKAPVAFSPGVQVPDRPGQGIALGKALEGSHRNRESSSAPC